MSAKLSNVPIDVIYQWCGLPETEYCPFNKDLEFKCQVSEKVHAVGASYFCVCCRQVCRILF